MPNHCTNKVSLLGPPEVRAAIEEKIRGHEPTYFGQANIEGPEVAFSFHAILPVPAEVLAHKYDRSGYDWQILHWGTKWAGYQFERTTRDEFSTTWIFRTAWAPPLLVLRALSKRYDCTVALSYHEEFPSRGRALFVSGVEKLLVVDSASPPAGAHTCAESEDACVACDKDAEWEMHYFEKHAEWIKQIAGRP